MCRGVGSSHACILTAVTYSILTSLLPCMYMSTHYTFTALYIHVYTLPCMYMSHTTLYVHVYTLPCMYMCMLISTILYVSHLAVLPLAHGRDGEEAASSHRCKEQVKWLHIPCVCVCVCVYVALCVWLHIPCV